MHCTNNWLAGNADGAAAYCRQIAPIIAVYVALELDCGLAATLVKSQIDPARTAWLTARAATADTLRGGYQRGDHWRPIEPPALQIVAGALDRDQLGGRSDG